jgi:hypothetical protein
MCSFLGAASFGFLRFVILFVFHKGKAAFQLSGEVGGFGCSMDGLAGFATQPLIQLIGGGPYEAAFFVDGHSLGCPALDDRLGLAEEVRDLLSAF